MGNSEEQQGTCRPFSERDGGWRPQESLQTVADLAKALARLKSQVPTVADPVNPEGTFFMEACHHHDDPLLLCFSELGDQQAHIHLCIYIYIYTQYIYIYIYTTYIYIYIYLFIYLYIYI